MIRKSISLILATVLILGPTGCTNQQTIAALVSIVGSSASAALTLGGVDAATSTRINGEFQTASQQIAAFVPGTPAEEVIQTLQIATADLGDIPGLNPKAQAYIDLALGTAETLVVLLQKQSGTVVAPSVGLSAHSVTRTPRVVTLAHPPDTPKAYKKAWDALGGGVPLNLPVGAPLFQGPTER